MELVALGNSEIRVSRVGFGCCPMGRHGWGTVPEQDLLQAASQARDHGVNFFDTADIYGLGVSEEILGRAVSGHRSDVIIATKFGCRRSPEGTTYFDTSPTWMEQALDASLDRLGTDYIDLYQAHYPDGVTPIEEMVDGLEGEVRKGRIRAYGLSNFDVAEFEAAGISAPNLVSTQMEFSLCARQEEDNIAKWIENGLTPLSWGSLAHGLLSGKYESDEHFADGDRRNRPEYKAFHGDAFERNLQIVEMLKDLGAKYGKKTSQVAIRCILDDIPKLVALVGTKNESQLEQNAGATDWSLLPEERALLKQAGEISVEPRRMAGE